MIKISTSNFINILDAQVYHLQVWKSKLTNFKEDPNTHNLLFERYTFIC